jgi:hypothetical protein
LLKESGGEWEGDGEREPEIEKLWGERDREGEGERHDL